MDFRSYPNDRQPWESFEQYQYRLKEFRRIEEEKELRRLHISMGMPPSMPPPMSGMNGIGGRDESYLKFCARIDRERAEIELQRTKQNTKKLILLL